MNLTRLKKLASNTHHNKYAHSALILKGDRVLSYGYNFNHKHAEEAAIDRLLRRNKRGLDNSIPDGLHLISFMYNKKSERVNNSYPCKECMKRIQITTEIKRLTYFYKGQIWSVPIH